MKTTLESAIPPPKHITEGLVKVLVLSYAFFAIANVQGGPLPTATYAFSGEATGPFTVTPVSPTVVRDDQVLSFTSVLPFALTTGFVQGFDDLTIPTFPDRFFNGTFGWSGLGNDAVFGTVTVQTSVFTDPVNPATGDFFGSEDFTGTFQFTGGTGRYLNATGGGVYVAHSEYRPPTEPGTLFSGFTTVTATGAVMVGREARAQYQFKTLDVPGANDTFLYSRNNHGTVVGQGLAEDGVSSTGARFVNGQFFSYVAPGVTYTELDAVNDRGDITGSYVDEEGNQIAFTVFQGVQSNFTAAAGALLTVPGGLNNRRDVAGTFTEDPSFESIRAFIRVESAITPLDFPGQDVVATLAFNINERRQVVGWYRNGSGSHGFVTDGESFTTVDYPSAVLTRAFGINNQGAVAGYYRLVPRGPIKGFVWLHGDYVTVEVPGAVSTVPQAINDRGQLAGYYLGTDGRFHGFSATPTNGGSRNQ